MFCVFIDVFNLACGAFISYPLLSGVLYLMAVPSFEIKTPPGSVGDRSVLGFTDRCLHICGMPTAWLSGTVTPQLVRLLVARGSIAGYFSLVLPTGTADGSLLPCDSVFTSCPRTSHQVDDRGPGPIFLQAPCAWILLREAVGEPSPSLYPGICG